MSTVIIALKLAKNIPNMDADYIGVDKGTLCLLQQNLPVTLAIGDFDSVNTEEMKQIEAAVKEVIHLPCIKNDTDSEAAIKAAIQRGYNLIYLIGALGGRADHEYVNLRLAYQHPLQIILLDEQNRIEAYTPGTYQIKKEKYAYIGFFTEDEAEISLENFKYNLSWRKLKRQDLYTVSNEVIGEEGTLTVHHGTVLVIQSKDEG